MANAVVDDTVAFLHLRGVHVQPEKLDAMVKEALVRLRAGLYPADPRRTLTKSEAEALERGGLDLSPGDLGSTDPLARTVSEYTALLKDSLTTGEAANQLGVHPSRIRQQLVAAPPTLYGVRLTDGSWRIPRFQLDGNKPLPGVREVVAQLDPELHPVSVQRWFTTSNIDLLVDDPSAPSDLLGLELSPREWLRHGLPPLAAANLAKHL